MKRFLVKKKYLHMNMTPSDMTKCKTAVRIHFVFQSWQVRNHHYIDLVMY